MENENEHILALVKSGLSVIPITEGAKNPHQILGPKHDLLTRRATPEEVEKWLTTGITSWGVAGGTVSGNLVTLDFDEKHYPGLSDLWYAKLSDDQRAIVDTCHKNSTRNKGWHLRYRTQTAQETIKLARRVEFNEKTKKEEIVTTAETRAEGAYALIPPSAGYITTQGSLLDLPLVPDEIHEELIDVLRTFNEVEDEPATEYEWKEGDIKTGDRPGDRLNERATWNELLEPHGWAEEEKDRWRRPGKDIGEGISATTNYDNRPMFYVFSTSAAPFEANRGYSKFSVYTLLNHNGDFGAAAKVAAEMYPEEQSDIKIMKESVMDQCNLLLSKIPKDTRKDSILRLLTPLLEILASSASSEEAEIYIRNNIKTELDVKTEDVKSIIKHFKNIQFEMIIKAEVAKKKAEQIKAEPPLTEEEKQNAENILKSPTLLYDVLKTVHRCGIVGEEKNILTHYLSLTSRLLESPISVTVKGDSSAGKSFVLGKVLKPFPKSAYIDITDATAQSFFYTPKDYFKHKIIIIFERHGGEKSDYAIRSLQSEGKLKIQTTVKNPETNQFESMEIEREGPTGFITTTTDAMIHNENETRNISVFPDQSQKQTIDIYGATEARYLGIKKPSDEILKPWQCAQTLLEQLPVYIPFVKSLGKYFPSKILRTRRDYSHFLAFIEVSAFFHQKQRGRENIDEINYIRATLADYEIARITVEDSLSKSIYELPPKTIELIEVARKLPPGEGEDNGVFTITQLAKKILWDRDTVSKWMEPGSKKGYFTIVQESKGSKGAKYKVEEKDLPGDSFLPHISTLIKENPQETTHGIYNPLTGESVYPELEAEIPSTDAPTDSREDKNITDAEKKEEKDTPVKTVGASVQNTEVPNNLKTKNYYRSLDEFPDDLNSGVEKDEDGIDDPGYIPF